MNTTSASKYALAPGTQVRNEDFGLLFYTMKGPRLYFLSSGQLLDATFFKGDYSLEQWLQIQNEAESFSKDHVREIKKNLDRLTEKGVILEC
jgi:putative mycofactocin binding protein MftB